jgi:hypothetical protein
MHGDLIELSILQNLETNLIKKDFDHASGVFDVNDPY